MGWWLGLSWVSVVLLSGSSSWAWLVEGVGLIGGSAVSSHMVVPVRGCPVEGGWWVQEGTLQDGVRNRAGGRELHGEVEGQCGEGAVT